MAGGSAIMGRRTGSSAPPRTNAPGSFWERAWKRHERHRRPGWGAVGAAERRAAAEPFARTVRAAVPQPARPHLPVRVPAGRPALRGGTGRGVLDPPHAGAPRTRAAEIGRAHV